MKTDRSKRTECEFFAPVPAGRRPAVLVPSDCPDDDDFIVAQPTTKTPCRGRKKARNHNLLCRECFHDAYIIPTFECIKKCVDLRDDRYTVNYSLETLFPLELEGFDQAYTVKALKVEAGTTLRNVVDAVERTIGSRWKAGIFMLTVDLELTAECKPVSYKIRVDSVIAVRGGARIHFDFSGCSRFSHPVRPRPQQLLNYIRRAIHFPEGLSKGPKEITKPVVDFFQSKPRGCIWFNPEDVDKFWAEVDCS